MVDATNEAGQCKNEVRILRDKLKKAQSDIAQMEVQVQLKEQEVADQRNEQYQLLHKNKVESLRHSEGLQTHINALAKEKQGLEAQIRSLLTDKDQQVMAHIAQLDSFKEENEKLKRQIFMTDKIRTQLESKVIDTEDNIERIRKESERYRKKYNESKGELDKALREMENYGRILDQFEAKVKRLEMDN